MNEQTKIVIITADFGTNKEVARVMKQILNKGEKVAVKVIDLYAEPYPTGTHLTEKLHKNLLHHESPLQQFFFYGMDRVYGRVLYEWFISAVSGKIKKQLNDEQPDIIITTVPIFAAAQWKKKQKYSCKLYTIVTDYWVHRAWVHKEIDGYYVATEQTRDQLREYEIPMEKICVSGIPIRQGRQEFERRSQKYRCCPNKKVFITDGVEEIEWIALQLIKEERLQLYILCRENSALFTKLLPLQVQYPEKIKLYGHVENIYELYKEVDIMITKPESVTLAESMSVRLPIILSNPTSGKQKENALFLEKNGAARIAEKKDAVVHTVVSLFKDPASLYEMKQAQKCLSKKKSAMTIALNILCSHEQRKPI